LTRQTQGGYHFFHPVAACAIEGEPKRMGHQHTVCRRGHGRGLVLGCGLVLGATSLVGCIAPNSGSQIEFDFAASIQTATPRGGRPRPARPPPATFSTL